MAYLQSTCVSPFMGQYIAMITPKHQWLTVNLLGKTLLQNYGSKKHPYPKGFPFQFHSLNHEEYDQRFCRAVCSLNHSVPSDFSFTDQKLHDCGKSTIFENNNSVTSVMCSKKDCREKKIFSSLEVFVDHVKHEDHFVNATFHDSLLVPKTTEIWFKISANHYSSKTIIRDKTTGEFLGEIGGNLGLFVGASLLTFFEMGEFLVRLAFNAYKRKREVYKLPR